MLIANFLNSGKLPLHSEDNPEPKYTSILVSGATTIPKGSRIK